MCLPLKSFILVASFLVVIHQPYGYQSQAQPLTVPVKSASNGRNRTGINLKFPISKVKEANSSAAFTGR